MDPQQNFDVLCKFLGYGNPDTAQILFVGYEFGGNSNKEVAKANYPDRAAGRTRLYQQHLAESGKSYICLPRHKWADERGMSQEELKEDMTRSKFAVTERIQVYFSLAYQRRLLGHNLDSYVSLKQYDIEEFCASHELQVNLFPIQTPREHAAYPERLLEVYAVPKLDKQRINDFLWTKGHRLELLAKLFSDVSRQAKRFVILFMGCEEKRNEICAKIFPQHQFAQMQRYEFKGKTYKRKRTLFRSEDRTVWFTQHPSGGLLTPSVADFIIDEIHAFGAGKVEEP